MFGKDVRCVCKRRTDGGEKDGGGKDGRASGVAAKKLEPRTEMWGI